ncbi:MAG: hypothetical protein ACI9K2_007556 [Myxococcota bacterium]|jgi:hypothetical protein
MRTLLCACLLLGCGGDTPPPAAASATPVDAPAPAPVLDLSSHGWLSHAVWAPAEFQALVDADREGWIALHANDYETAAKRLETPTSRARAEWMLATLHRDLTRLTGFAVETFFAEWDARTGLPEDSAATMIATLGSFCAESGALSGWASRCKSDSPGFDMAQEIARGRAPWDHESMDVYGKRMALHRKARTAGNVEPLVASSVVPLVREPVGDFERLFYDPCLHRTLADYWQNRYTQSLDGDGWGSMSSFADLGLAGNIFSPWLLPEDFRAEMRVATSAGVVGARAPSLRRLGVGTNPHAGDDPVSARQEVASLDSGLADWRADLEANATPEGLAILTDLRLVERFRQEWLTTRARYALLEDRPRQALAYLNAARDNGDLMVGPANSPILWALLAEAQLRNGRAREALDALHVLSGEHPEVLGLREVVGSLAVLRGLDRTGDSKEE